MPKKSFAERSFRNLPVLLAFAGLFMFIYTLLSEDEPPMQSLYWFLLVIAAFFLPYIKEIAFHDIKLTLNKGLEEQRELLEEKIEQEFRGGYEKVRQVDAEFGEIRDELISGYQQYLQHLVTDESERLEKSRMLTTLYLNELEVEVRALKQLLTETGFYTHTIDEAYDVHLYEALKAFQASQGMVPDGVFGHNSYRNLLALRTSANH